MAIASTIEWEVRSTATAGNANGGGYKPGASGTDFSQQNAAQYNLTGVTTAAADAILLHASAAADMVGNIANITGGTNFTVGRYEIISVVVGTSITLDRNCTTAAGAAGVVNIGGALNFGTADDAVFESMEPGNIMHIKAATYTMTALAVLKDGTSTSPIILRGYNAARNDTPAFGSQPVLAFGANASSFGDYFNLHNITCTTTSANGLDLNTGGLAQNCKSTNSSGTAGRAGFRIVLGGAIIACEAISTNGDAIVLADDRNRVFGNYCHDSAVGVSITTSPVGTMIAFNIVDACTTALEIPANSTSVSIIGNTLYGAATPAGTGIDLLATTSTNLLVMNNTISGFTTGVNSAAVVGSNFYDYNNFFNNTTDRVNVTAGPNDTALDPGFTDAPNGNFAIGANLKAKGFPGAFPGGLTTGYLDIGAAQRQEPAGGSGGGLRIVAPGGLG